MSGAGTSTSVVVGVDVGGTSVKGGRSDGRTAVRPTGGDALGALRQVLHDLVDGDTTAIGVAVPGVLESGTVRFAANLGWRDLPLRDELEGEFGRPVTIGHDIVAAALAEAAGEELLFVAGGTGVAAALVQHGRGRPVELGHVVLDPEGVPCACGRRGCLETFASGPAIARAHGTLDARGVAAALDTDERAARAWRTATTALGRALATAVLLLDPPVIVLGGGVALAGDLLLEPVRATLAAELPWRATPPVRLARLGADAGRHGALLLADRAVTA